MSNPPGLYTIQLIPPVQSLSPGISPLATGVCQRGPYAGMSIASITTARNTAQQALIALLTGGKPVTLAYGEGQGHRSVTYAKTNEAALRQLITELNQALGLGGRRAIGVRF